ncbi:MAG: hypothetical protein ACLQFR_30745 [Streptosporangiaceae bacterium]
MAAAAADQEAFRAGEVRTVSCFLAGSTDPYPRHPRQGKLELTQDRIVWRPFWSVQRTPIAIDKRVHSVEVREAGRAEWNLKKGGNAFGVPVPEFQVVVCHTDRGVVELSVPSTDVAVVLTALRR